MPQWTYATVHVTGSTSSTSSTFSAASAPHVGMLSPDKQMVWAEWTTLSGERKQGWVLAKDYVSKKDPPPPPTKEQLLLAAVSALPIPSFTRDSVVRACDACPEMMDCFKQAPVLALAAYDKQLRAAMIAVAGQKGGKLRDVMAAVQLAYAFRELVAVNLNVMEYYRYMVEISQKAEPSTLAQSLERYRAYHPSYAATNHRHWLSQFWNILKLLTASKRGDADALFDWCLRAAKDPGREPNPNFILRFVADEENHFDYKWTVAQFNEAHTRWYETRGKRAEWIQGVGGPERANADIWRKAVPRAITVDGFQFRGLTTPLDFYDEGVVMKHCIAGYWGGQRDGQYVVYAVSDAKDKRVGTLVVNVSHPHGNGVMRCAIRSDRDGFRTHANGYPSDAAKAAARELCALLSLPQKIRDEKVGEGTAHKTGDAASLRPAGGPLLTVQDHARYPEIMDRLDRLRARCTCSDCLGSTRRSAKEWGQEFGVVFLQNNWGEWRVDLPEAVRS